MNDVELVDGSVAKGQGVLVERYAPRSSSAEHSVMTDAMPLAESSAFITLQTDAVTQGLPLCRDELMSGVAGSLCIHICTLPAAPSLSEVSI